MSSEKSLSRLVGEYMWGNDLPIYAALFEKGATVQLDPSDAQKILDTLAQNEEYHMKRDEMNAAIHRAETVRYSPITSETIAQRERLQKLMQEQGVPM